MLICFSKGAAIMNRTLAGLVFVVIVFFNTVYSQTPVAAGEAKNLTEKADSLFRQGKLDEAIETAEKVVDLEKDSKSADSASYANALVNLARMKRDYFLILRENLESGKIEPRQRQAAVDKMLKMAKEADASLRQALELNEQSGRGETAQTADIKSDLARLLYTYLGSKQSIDDSEKLFLESIALNEKIRGKDADETLFTVLKTGDFYYEMSNYEKALPFYERYIQTNEKTHGKNYPNLADALRPYASILFATFQEREASDAIKRISAITQKTEEMPKANLNFHLRSKDSVALNMKIVPEYRKESELFKAKLTAEGRTLNGNNVSMMPRLLAVPVSVTIDENGKVVEAAADGKVKDKNLALRAEQEISKWTIRPFAYNGTPRKLRGILYYKEIR